MNSEGVYINLEFELTQSYAAYGSQVNMLTN